MNAVIIRWKDASAGAGWTAIGQSLGLMNPITLGFIVHEDDESVTVATTVCDDECNGQVCIPTSWIEARYDLDEEEILDLIV